MAKALLGTFAADPRVSAKITAENRLLRQRIADLEAHVIRLQGENDSLVEQLDRATEDSMQPA